MLRRSPARPGVHLARPDRHRGGHRHLRRAQRRLQRAAHRRRAHEGLDLRRADRPRAPERPQVEVQRADQDRRHRARPLAHRLQEGWTGRGPRPRHGRAPPAQSTGRSGPGRRDRAPGGAPEAVSGTALATVRCYFEDVEVNVPLETPGVTLTRAHVALFVGVTGDATLRDPDSVPDLLPLCLSSGLGWRVPRPPLAVLAFMGFEWRFLSALSVGDTIHSVSLTLAKRNMREGGVV